MARAFPLTALPVPLLINLHAIRDSYSNLKSQPSHHKNADAMRSKKRRAPNQKPERKNAVGCCTCERRSHARRGFSFLFLAHEPDVCYVHDLLEFGGDHNMVCRLFDEESEPPVELADMVGLLSAELL